MEKIFQLIKINDSAHKTLDNITAHKYIYFGNCKTLLIFRTAFFQTPNCSIHCQIAKEVADFRFSWIYFCLAYICVLEGFT